jgi:DNA-binding NtrC family response regulator
VKTPDRILVVDDEPVIRETLAEFLQQEGFAIVAVGSGEDALQRAAKQRFDVVLCDVNLPGLDGIEVLERFARVSPDTFVVLITAYATVETAIEAFQKGAHDYLMKPIILREVLGKLRRLLRQRELHRENQWLRRELNRLSEAEPSEMVVGKSPAMRAAVDLAKRVGPTPSPVLILGESGTGKELLARAVHRFAAVARTGEGKFIPVNCGAISEDMIEEQLFGHATRGQPGVFENAGAGSVFLDEVGELPPSVQTKLLRVIEQREVFPVGANEPDTIEARVIAATNKDLAAEVAEGRFRADLFYRLNVVSVTLPPLRDRREDIPELAQFLLEKHARALGKRFAGVSHDALQTLAGHSWKGNVRELENALQRAVILGDGPLVTPADLPPDLAPQGADPGAVDELNAAVERFEKLHIERILRLAPDKREAARRLGIGLSSLYRKIEQYGIGG